MDSFALEKAVAQTAQRPPLLAAHLPWRLLPNEHVFLCRQPGTRKSRAAVRSRESLPEHRI